MSSDSNFQKELNHYKSEVRKKLLCDSKVSKAFFSDFENDIDNYIAENNVDSITEIYNHFGTADDIANAFFETVDVKTVKKKINIKKLIAVLVVAVIAIWAVVAVVDFVDSKKDQTSYEVHFDTDVESRYENISQEILT